MDAYNKQTSRRKYAKNPDYHNFKNAVWVAKNEGAMPPVRDLIPAEDGDEDDADSDDDIQMGGATQNFRCPLTTNILEDPITKYVLLPLILSLIQQRQTDAPFARSYWRFDERTAPFASTRTPAAPSSNTSLQAIIAALPPAVRPRSASEASDPTPRFPRKWRRSREERKKSNLPDARRPPYCTDLAESWPITKLSTQPFALTIGTRMEIAIDIGCENVQTRGRGKGGSENTRG